MKHQRTWLTDAWWGRHIIGLAYLLLICGIIPLAAHADQDFVIFGMEGVWLKENSTVVSGDVGVNIASPDPFPGNGVELVVGAGVELLSSTIQLMANSVKVTQGVQVYNVLTNKLIGNGQVQGQVVTPVMMPIVSSLPVMASVEPGTQDVDVPKNGMLTLSAGKYRRLKAKLNSTITLSGGEYHFKEWDVGQNVTINVDTPVDIRIGEKLIVGRDSTVAPSPNATTLTAQDVTILVNGKNGHADHMGGSPKAAQFGLRTTIRAKVHVPKGTIWVRQHSTLTGTILGKGVILGNGATAIFEGGFGLNAGSATLSADAGPDQTVTVGDSVMLDGSGSTDMAGQLLTFEWSLLSVPENSQATLSNPSSVVPSFNVDESGIYSIQLIVKQGTFEGHPDTVLISTANSPPMANAGQDQSAFVSEQVLLDGTNSHDVDNDSLTYQWRLTSVPTGSKARLSDATSPTPSFTVRPSGEYTVELTVNDGHRDSDPDQIVITTGNATPVAHPGQDQTVNRRTVVRLDGSESNDVNHDPLTYSWSFSSLPMGSTATLSDRHASDPTFVADHLGLYVVQLIVNDGTVGSIPETIVITGVNMPPIADAGADQTVTVGTIVALDGGNSSDLEDDPLTFQWTLTDKPEGSTVKVLNPTLAFPSLVPDLPGVYDISLVVGDGFDFSVLDRVLVTAEALPQAPVPGLLLTNPPDEAVVSFNSISVSGLVSDATAMVTVNGVTASVTEGIFLADGIQLQEGLNTIIVRARDGMGNTNSVSVNVTFRPIATTFMYPILGPEVWVKQNADDEKFTAEFINCEPSAQYQLVITNGTTSGTERVNSGTVFLNGAEVIGAQELTASVGQIVRPIVVRARNDLVVQLQGDIAAHVQAVIECTANCLAVSIQEPVGGTTVNDEEVVVQGTVTTSSLNPVGVIVNQQAAKVSDATYAIGGLAVRDGTGTTGTTTIIAQIANACEHRASTAIQITTTQFSINQVQLRATPDRNVASSLVDLRVSTDLEHPISTIAWDFEGDGSIDVQGSDLFEQTVTFTQAGIYTPRVFVTDDQGFTFEAAAVLLVEDPVAFESMLNAKWSDVMSALAQGEIEQALSGILIKKRPVMRHDWTVLKDHLGDLASIFGVPLQLIDGQGLRAVARNPTPVTLGSVKFPLEVEFVLDADGQWRIRGF